MPAAARISGTAATMLDPFELQNMRYRWRQWIKFPATGRSALEAFNEGYSCARHPPAAHPFLAQADMECRQGHSRLLRLRRE